MKVKTFVKTLARMKFINSPEDLEKYKIQEEKAKMTENENGYEDIADTPIYPLIAITALDAMHESLMDKIDKYAATKDNFSMLVVGPGPEAMPFTENVETVAKWFEHGNLALMDYNHTILDKAKQYLREKGFEKAGLNIVDIPHDAFLGLNAVGEKKIFVRQGDVRDHLKFMPESVTCIDQTVAVHHATPYMGDVRKIVQEFYRVLEKDGMVHWATGNVDMKHTETKIIKLAQEVAEKYGKDVLVLDKREERSGYIAESFFESGKQYDEVPVVDARPEGDYLTAEVGFDGLFTVGVENNGTPVPLIDQNDPEDKREHVDKVNKYYANIKARADSNITQAVVDKYYSAQGTKEIPGAEEVKQKLFAALDKETEDAKRGVVEYYTAPEKIVRVMEEEGFRDVSISYNSDNTFCNIVALK